MAPCIRSERTTGLTLNTVSVNPTRRDPAVRPGRGRLASSGDDGDAVPIENDLNNRQIQREKTEVVLGHFGGGIWKSVFLKYPLRPTTPSELRKLRENQSKFSIDTLQDWGTS